jgi:hypothetical protein
VSVPIAAAVLWVIAVLGSYSRAERVAIGLALVFLTYPVAAFLGHPDGRAVARDPLTPQFPHTSAFLLVAVALIGTTISPYMQFYVSSVVVDRKIGPQQYPAERFDAVNGAILSDAAAVHRGSAGRVPARGGRRPPVQLARRRRGSERGAFGVRVAPAGATVLGTVHDPARRRCGTGSGTGQPGLAGGEHAGAQRTDHAGAADFRVVLAKRRSVLGAAANRSAFRVVATVSVAAIAVLAVAALVVDLA